jgi:hypothetical protein
LFELRRTLDFLSSAALTRALAESCSLSWKTYDDSLFLNAVYTLMPWKDKPGAAEMQMSRRSEVEDRYDLIYRRMVDAWHEAMKQGPDACHRLLSRIEQTRDKDRAHMDAVASDVRDINREVVEELGIAIRRCAQIKLASTIAVAACSGGASLYASAGTAAAAGIANTGYSIATSLITNWDKAPSAKIIGVSVEAGKYAGNAAADVIGDKWIREAAAATHEQVLAESLKRMEQARSGFCNAVRHRGRANSVRAFGRAADDATAAARNLNQANSQIARGTRLKVGAAIFFTAVDILQGIDEYLEDVAD